MEGSRKEKKGRNRSFLNASLSMADIDFKPDRFKRGQRATREVNVLHHCDASMATLTGDVNQLLLNLLTSCDLTNLKPFATPMLPQ